MTADADNAGRSDPDSAPMDAEDYPETAAGTSHGAGDAETELVPPATAADPAHAWSREDPVTEALSRPWRSVWAIASIGLLCAVIVAFAISGVVALMRENHGATQPSPTTPTQSASAPPPGSPGTPQAARADDDEFVALAISPHAIGTLHLGGFGTSGIQDRANQIALSECRAGTGNDDCLLVNAGMFHGCVSYAIDTSQRTWASGSGVDSDSARANALSRLGTPASSVYAQCSDPPGILRFGSPIAPTTGPATTTAQLSITSLPGTDDLGWSAYPDARCHSGNQPAVMARTTKSVLVVCQIQPGNFYYRGVRLSDGASIELANAVRSSGGFDVTNPVDGTRYQIRSTSLTIAPPDAQASSEPMLDYASS
jgi:Domain of unknown function (DUF4189)